MNGETFPMNPVVAVVAARDGAGKTAIAVNLAAVFARAGGSVLVDLDLHFGGVESALRVEPDARVDEAVRKLSSRSRASVESFLAPHSCGVGVLCAPISPIVADQLRPTDVFAVVDKVCALGKPVVLDTSGGLGEYALGATERASHTIVVSRTDVSSVRATRKLLDTWTQLQIEPRTPLLVLGQPPGRQSLTTSDIEGIIGLPVSSVVPFADAVSVSADVGVPFVESDRNSKIAKSMVHFAESLMSASTSATTSATDGTDKADGS